MKALSGICAVMGLSVCSALSWGKVMMDTPVYPNAKVVDSFNGVRSHHPVIASAMKKVNGIVKADEEQNLDGQLLRKLYRLPDENSHFSAYQFYTDYFRSIGVKPLYDCQRFQCGDSNLWANNVFKIPTLYGLDKEQAYFIGTKEEGGNRSYYSVYTVRRGNHRSYVLVDIFESDKKIEKESVVTRQLSYTQLKEAGAIYLSVDEGSNVAEKIKMILSNHIKGEKTGALILMTTKLASSVEAFDQHKDEAEQKVMWLKAQLTTAGVKASQFRLIYAGSDQKQSSYYQLKVLPLAQDN